MAAVNPIGRAGADAVVVGAGLAGLVATAELAATGRHVILVDQEPEQSLGGQAFWSFGGLFLVDSPEQRRLRIKDSRELAWQDWLGTAGFDRPEDEWPRRTAEAYVDWAAGEKRSWLHEMGIRFLPNVGWAERGGQLANGPGNSVPRFHVTWGTGPGLLKPFVALVREAQRNGLVELRFRHRVDALTVVQQLAHRTQLELTLHEGRNRIVRRLLEAVGHPVVRLVRLQVGPVRLAGLKPGHVRLLRRDEVAALFALTSM
jgi:predicted oxidoreductase